MRPLLGAVLLLLAAAARAGYEDGAHSASCEAWCNRFSRDKGEAACKAHMLQISPLLPTCSRHLHADNHALRSFSS